MVNAYSIYTKDIKPKGFSVIEINGYVSEEAVQLARWILMDERLRKRMVEHNYQRATKFFSYQVLHRILKGLMLEYHWLF